MRGRGLDRLDCGGWRGGCGRFRCEARVGGRGSWGWEVVIREKGVEDPLVLLSAECLATKINGEVRQSERERRA